MPRVRFFPRRASEPPDWIPPDTPDDEPILEGHAPERPLDPAEHGRRWKRWGQAGGAALTVAATAGALAWGRKRRDRGK